MNESSTRLRSARKDVRDHRPRLCPRHRCYHPPSYHHDWREQVKQGIVGEDGIEPYDVLALFISLAYIAISLDATGLLRFLAFLICLKAGRQGREAKGKTLYLLLYFFFWSAGVLVGNDPVILSGTAFLVYFTRVAGISPPDAWIWAEFVAANISSAVLVSSNPTNLVIATGFDVNFITYTAYMVLPSFGSALGGLVAMMVYFRNRDGVKDDKDGAGEEKSGIRKLVESVPGIGPRLKVDRKESHIRHRTNVPTDGTAAATTPNADDPYTPSSHPNANEATTPASEAASSTPITSSKTKKRTPLIYIPETIIRPDVDPRAALVDKTGAIFGSIVMAITLATLVGTSVIGGVKVFEIAVPGAVLCFVRDGVADYLRWRKLQLDKTRPSDEVEEPQQQQQENGGTADSNGSKEMVNGAEAAKEVEEIEMQTLAAPRPDVDGTDVKSPSPSSPPVSAAPSSTPSLLQQSLAAATHSAASSASNLT